MSDPEPQLLDEVRQLRAELSAARAEFNSREEERPLVIHGARFQLCDKGSIARRLGISEDTFDRWVTKGYLPQPFDPERRGGRGRKVLLWDLYECVEKVRSYQR
jgi:transposase-like protein